MNGSVGDWYGRQMDGGILWFLMLVSSVAGVTWRYWLDVRDAERWRNR